MKLTHRVSAMIVHISDHNSFDREDLIQLLKDVNVSLLLADQKFKDISGDIDFCLNKLSDTTMSRRQA